MKYTSKNPSIAFVTNSGTVTGVSVGTTAIEVRDDSDKYLGQIPTTVVSSAEYVPTTGITLSATSVELKYAYGTSKQITATVSPANATNKTVKWTSSNPSVLSCVDGYLKCLKSGSGNLSVTAETADGQTATCSVTIVENGTSVNSVSPDFINASATGGTYDIAVNITNNDGYYSGYKVYAANEGEYGQAFSVSNQTQDGFKLKINQNFGDARSFRIIVKGIDSDGYSAITVNQPYSRVEAGFAYSSKHRVYDKVKGKVADEEEVDTTYFLANQDPTKGQTGYRHVRDDEGILISGGDIVYIECSESAFEEIYSKTTTSKPWLIKRSYHEYRSDLGGLIGIDAETNDTGVQRSAYLVLPGGHKYPVVQDA